MTYENVVMECDNSYNSQIKNSLPYQTKKKTERVVKSKHMYQFGVSKYIRSNG